MADVPPAAPSPGHPTPPPPGDGARVLLLTGPSGAETLEARAVVSAVGQLNRPKLPELPGMDDFTGPIFHSAQWPDELDEPGALTGKRVAIVGSGASAMQIGPAQRRIGISPVSVAWVGVGSSQPGASSIGCGSPAGRERAVRVTPALATTTSTAAATRSGVISWLSSRTPANSATTGL